MKSQPKVSSKGVSQYSFAIFLLLIMSLFMAGNVQAKRPQPAPGPTGPSNYAFWSGDQNKTDIMEEFPRVCTSGQMAPDGTSGTYSCSLNSSKILYDFSNMESIPIHRRGEDWRCKSPRFFIDPDMQYVYSWNGDCKSGCGVSVVNDTSVISTSVSRLIIEGFGTVTSNEFNPFNKPQSVKIDYLHVTLFGIKGNDKVLAVCELTPRANYPVTFVTTPVN